MLHVTIQRNTFIFAMRSFITKHHWKLINILCCVACIWQFYGVVYDWVYPSQKTTDVTEKKLDDIEFPIIFKICIKPGFNNTAFKEEGYSDITDYFLGRSRFNSSVYGWAGHSGAQRTVEVVYEKVQFHPNVEDVISR